MKKVVALLLVLMFALSMTVTAFADVVDDYAAKLKGKTWEYQDYTTYTFKSVGASLGRFEIWCKTITYPASNLFLYADESDNVYLFLAQNYGSGVAQILFAKDGKSFILLSDGLAIQYKAK